MTRTESIPAQNVESLDNRISKIIVATGAIAQLGERDNGIVEVGGSIPPGSTSLSSAAWSLA